MPDYLPYRDDIETIAPDEQEAHAKIVEVMTKGLAHRPLGGINRARLVVYTAMANLQRQENNRPTTEPTSIEQVPV